MTSDEKIPVRSPMLTVAEASAWMRCSAQTIRLWVKKGRLKACRADVGSSRILISRSEIERLIGKAK